MRVFELVREERAWRSTTTPKQRKTMQELDRRTDARYSTTYNMGKAKRQLFINRA
jgi:hypothetical protein